MDTVTGVALRAVPLPSSRVAYLRLIDSCITQLKAQGPSRTCNESKEEEEASRVLMFVPAALSPRRQTPLAASSTRRREREVQPQSTCTPNRWSSAATHTRKGSTSFGACEVRCWRWLFGNKIPVSASICGLGFGV